MVGTGGMSSSIFRNRTKWTHHIIWIKYPINSLTSFPTELSSFKVSLGYQLPLFAKQESEIAVPSVQLYGLQNS